MKNKITSIYAMITMVIISASHSTHTMLPQALYRKMEENRQSYGSTESSNTSKKATVSVQQPYCSKKTAITAAGITVCAVVAIRHAKRGGITRSIKEMIMRNR